MTQGRIVALAAAVVLLLPGLGLVAAGGSLGMVWLAGDRDGYLSRTFDPVGTASAAVVTSDLGVVIDAGVPHGLLDRLDLDVRLQVQPVDGSGPLFVGLGPSDQVSQYLAGSTHDLVTRVDGTRLILAMVPGGGVSLPAPGSEPFWVASAHGPGAAQLDWQPRAGSYSVVVMNADGSPGVRAEVVAAGRAGFLGPLAVALLVLGVAVVAVAVLLAVLAARSGRRRPGGPPGPVATTNPGWATPQGAAEPVQHSPSARR